MKMDENDVPKLLELSIRSLVTNEPAAIDAFKVIPKELFTPFFTAAFTGGHKNTVIALVKVWPFTCLHIGTLSAQEPQRELLEVMIESLQFLSDLSSASRSPKLRILDVRQGVHCRTTCPEISKKSPTCLHSCAYSENSIMKLERQHSTGNSESESQPLWKPMELIVDLILDGSLREREFFSLLVNKVHQSSGSVHVCCRDLQIDDFSYARPLLNFLDLSCIHKLEVEGTSLSEISRLLSHTVHLDTLSMSKVTCRSLNGNVFRMFLRHLGRMSNLKEISLCAFFLTDHLENLLRVLPPGLEFLYLPFCELSYRDVKFLSQSPLANQLKLLDLSSNTMYWDGIGLFQTLLQKLSGTLQLLAVNHCHLTDSKISSLIPALTQCTHLRVFSFLCNPITMSMLMRIMHYLTPLTELKHVMYPIPVHCYEQWHFHSSLDRQKLADVKAQLKMMLQMAKRSDMNWITYSC